MNTHEVDGRGRMKRRRWSALVVLPMLLLLSAPSCSPAIKALGTAVGRSAEELAPAVDDVARSTGRDADQLAEALAGSETAQLIIKLAKDPGVEVACKYIGGRATQSQVRITPGGVDWVKRMVEAQQRMEPVNEACGVAGKIAGAL